MCDCQLCTTRTSCSNASRLNFIKRSHFCSCGKNEAGCPCILRYFGFSDSVNSVCKNLPRWHVTLKRQEFNIFLKRDGYRYALSRSLHVPWEEYSFSSQAHALSRDHILIFWCLFCVTKELWAFWENAQYSSLSIWGNFFFLFFFLFGIQWFFLRLFQVSRLKWSCVPNLDRSTCKSLIISVLKLFRYLAESRASIFNFYFVAKVRA